MTQNDSLKTSRFVTMGALVLIVTALYWARPILVPLALAILFSFLLAPLEYRLRRLKLPRMLSVLVTVVISFAIVAGIGFVVWNQMTDFAGRLPQYQQTIQAKVDSIRNGHGIIAGFEKAGEEVKHILAAPSASSPSSAVPPAPQPTPVVITNYNGFTSYSEGPFQLIADIGAMLLGPAGTAGLVAIFTVFMLLQREDLRDRLIRLVGRDQLTMTTHALDDAAARVSRYLIMQSILNGAVGVAVFISLWSIGEINHRPFPSPALFGLLAGLLRFIPYLGIWIAAFIPLLLSLAVYSGLSVTFETLGAFILIEALAANALEPIMFGSSTGITGLAVLVSAMFWTWLWGPLGLLLATPLTVCVVVIGKYVPALSFLNIMLSDEPALEPPDRVFERLLALDQREARTLIDEYHKHKTLEDLYDSLLLPVLATIEREIYVGHLEEDRHGEMLQILRRIIIDLGEQEKKSLEQQIPGDALRRGILPRGVTLRAICLPAHDESDEIAALMFAQLLDLRGYTVSTIPVDQLTSEMVEAVEKNPTDLVCVSAVPPSATRPVSYLCKRLHEKIPNIDILIGLWTMINLRDSHHRIACAPNMQIAATFRDALKQAHQLAQSRMLAAPNAAPAE